MRRGTAATSTMLVGLGLACQFVSFVFAEAGMPGFSITIAILGTIAFFAGLSEYANGKGYSRLFAVLGVFSLFGLLILALLSDKHPDRLVVNK